MSWKAEWKVGKDDRWYSTDHRFATPQEAQAYAFRYHVRPHEYWDLGPVKKLRTVECDDPVTHEWGYGICARAPKVA